MEAEPTVQTTSDRPADFYTVLGWLDKNRQPLITGAVVAILVGVVIAFIVWRGNKQEVEAGEALTAVLAARDAGGGVSAESLLKVAADYSGTAAAARAQLAAAGQLFSEGKYAAAQAQFQKFVVDSGDSALAAQANLGVASSLEAQGKLAEAQAAFKAVADRKSDVAASAQAKFSLARLLQAEGKLAQARDLYLELANDPNSLSGAEAAGKLGELFQQHPELRPAPPAPATNTTSVLPLK